tara:strand:- start:148 stop:342 length:195 start_codon:yes stop_codon:yes gene_type:complete
MADTNIDFHRTTEITIESREFEYFKTFEWTFTNKDGVRTKITVFTDDFNLQIEDKGTRVVSEEE